MGGKENGDVSGKRVVGGRCDDRPAERWGSRVRDQVVFLINMLMHVLGACLRSAGGIGLLWLSQLQHVLSVVVHFVRVAMC